MRAALQTCLLAACLAVALARYKSTDFTDEERMEATRQAVKEAKVYMDEFERNRTKNARIQAESGMTSAQVLGKFFRQASLKAEKLGKARLMMEHAVRRAERLLLEKKRVKMASTASKEKKAEVLAQELFHIPGTLLTEKEYAYISQEAGCEEVRNENIFCNPSSTTTFRTHDGTCNNLQRPAEGSSLTPFRRLLPAHYEDGLNQPNGVRQSTMTNNIFYNPFAPPYPSARQVSNTIVTDQPINDGVHTHLLMQWGQFMDHDLDLAVEFSNIRCRGCESNDICLPIQVQRDDPDFGVFQRNEGDCLEFHRTIPTCRKSFEFGPREQINELTHYIDGSMVYGSTKARANFLRTRNNFVNKGMLTLGQRSDSKPYLPQLRTEPLDDGLCQIPFEDYKGNEGRPRPGLNGKCCPDGPRPLEAPNQWCFLAGDNRANEQASLTVMHTLWAREHNRVARELNIINPHWDDERVYQEARKIVIAEIQRIQYEEYLPAVFGRTLYDAMIGPYPGYQPQINPSIPNAFATAAFRFGHSQIQNEFQRLDFNFQPIAQGPLSLVDSFFNPNELLNGGGTDPIVRGWLTQPARFLDEFLNSILTSRLFEQNNRKGQGMDLASLNIQRSRDHGLPPYTVWRDFCQAQFKNTVGGFQTINFANEITRVRLLQTYGSLDTVDLFVGGLAEAPLPGAIIGPTFACIFALTFSNLRAGDRFWYERTDGAQAFTPGQLAQIKQTSMSRIICDNADNIPTIQRNPFFQGTRWPCSTTIPKMSFDPWNLCYYKVQFLPHDANIEYLFANLRDGSTGYRVFEGPNSQNREQCIPFICPSTTQNNVIYTTPTINHPNYESCALTVNFNLPANLGWTSVRVYSGELTTSNIHESSGIFRTQSACHASPNIAVHYDCPGNGPGRIWSKNEKLASTEELEEELVRILADRNESDSNSSGERKSTESGNYLKRVSLNDPEFLEQIPEEFRLLLKSKTAPSDDQPSSEQPEENKPMNETMKGEESQHKPEREDDELVQLLKETLEELKNN